MIKNTILLKYDEKNYHEQIDQYTACCLTCLRNVSQKLFYSPYLTTNYLNEMLRVNASGKGGKLQQFYLRTIDKHPAQFK